MFIEIVRPKKPQHRDPYDEGRAQYPGSKHNPCGPGLPADQEPQCHERGDPESEDAKTSGIEYPYDLLHAFHGRTSAKDIARPPRSLQGRCIARNQNGSRVLVWVEDTKVTKAGVKELRKALPGCKIIP
jgi:hypothetical protein